MPARLNLISRITATLARELESELAALIIDAVDGGASVGFTRPLADVDARAWAQELASDVEARRAIVLVARSGTSLRGTVQLRFSTYPNGRHRGEVAKLMVHRSARGEGIGTRLMQAIESEAKLAELRTLILDTETGSDAERLYRRLGWTLAGVIPEYAASPGGGIRSTSFLYRLI
jgi:GNAT superfamily N-acetyltransferase